MNTQRISNQALEIIDQYLNFRIGSTTISIPYFNNKKRGIRAGLRAQVGKGSPKDIFEEIQHEALKEKISLNDFDAETIKKLLVNADIGIDCSGFAYYILNSESMSRKKGSLDRHLHFPFGRGGLLGMIRRRMSPEKNVNVATLAHDRNSRALPLKDAQPGDFISFLDGDEDYIRDHIIVIHQIEYQDFIPMTIHYSHSIATPEDGEYNHGVRQGTIDIVDINKPLEEQKWNEVCLFQKSLKSKTELRRLNWF